jgi:hypothetical protein
MYLVILSNILRHNKVQSCIPEYFKFKSIPRISYKYASTIASKLFTYKQTSWYLDIDNLTLNPSMCSCFSSPFNYSPASHVITGDVDIFSDFQLFSGLSTTDETLVVEMRIWCIKIGNVFALHS